LLLLLCCWLPLLLLLQTKIIYQPLVHGIIYP
jgi:hypothetical protein